ncbi:hypothetical protein V8E36_006079 [Tilletia maclaganii]
MPRGLGAAPRSDDREDDALPTRGLGGIGSSKRRAPRADKYADVVVEAEDDDDEDQDDNGIAALPGDGATPFSRSDHGASSSRLGFGLGSAGAAGLRAKRKRSNLLAMRANEDEDDEPDEFMDGASSSSVDDDDGDDMEVNGKGERRRTKKFADDVDEDQEFAPSVGQGRGGLGSSRSRPRRRDENEEEGGGRVQTSLRRRGLGAASMFVKATRTETPEETMDTSETAGDAQQAAPDRQTVQAPTTEGTTNGAPGPPPGPPPSLPSSINPYAPSSTMQSSGMPTAFGAAVPAPSAFKKREPPSSSSSSKSNRPPIAMPRFATSTSKFDPAAMLLSMGWSGAGLGKEGEGMTNPIEVQLRPEKAGLAFGGRKEMTKQTRAEEKRRGHREGSPPAVAGSDEDDEEGGSSGAEDRRSRRRKGGNKKKSKADASPGAVEKSWTKRERKPRKPHVEHRLYEQIIEEAGGLPETDPSVGKVYDAHGREHASLAAALAHHAVPTQDESSTHLPELRHNLALLCDSNRRNLDVLARAGADLLERRRWLRRERDEAERKMSSQRAVAQGLKKVLGVVRALEGVGVAAQKAGAGKSASSSLDATGAEDAVLDAFDPIVARILNDHRSDVQKYGLDEAVVGAIAPMVKRSLRHWDPFSQPSCLTAHFLRWQDVLQPERLGIPQPTESRPAQKDNTMRPYETLLWQIWMPRVRSALNNHWDPATDPALPLPLIEIWRPLLPDFIMENIISQLLLPKLSKAVSEWSPSWRRRGAAAAPTIELHQIVFPWLPVLSDRMDEIIAEARRRVKSMLKSWKVSVPMPAQLEEWKQFIDANEWDSMLLTNIVPKLSARLRDDFEVNPGDQDIGPLEDVLAWRHVLRKSVLSRMLEVEFFGKWLRILHMWLTQPSIEFEEVAQWYAFWKSWFPDDIAELPGVIHGFQKGASLIEDAAALGDRREDLRLPDLNPLSRAAFTAAQDVLEHHHRGTHHHTALRAGQPTGANKEMTFRTIVEEAAGGADLLVIPLNRSHLSTGHALYRMSDTVDTAGSGAGVVFYIDEEVCFVETRREEGEVVFEPASVEELIELARPKQR